ncbi:50S ribosomal protein L25/general stress protein Ctc [Bacillus sp. FJAT-49736]|uniref:50S ribosomal protein L25/general stress protein Ctc n=1 Tax=Bacillus sp. FJAT-49736 TaxID=2833582 RepID=UPI001BCA2726|nr:50S ribosomal protein L25/general stress protein Ctc [Bacillus sp. FJAT-49736]MBS4175771.1 50S ribosomal protein L25/general stress protein Ctc [Bacillus sp. FJAT-49736]
MVAILDAKRRNNKQHSELQQLRRNGNIPAVVYGYKSENTPVYVSEADFTRTIREAGRNGVISLNLEGQKQNVILNDYQEDSLKKTIVHLDFLAVDLSSEIEANVRVELIGESSGVKDGGVLQQPIHELSVTAKPNDIPDAIRVDVSNLQVGETVSISDIKGNYPFSINHEDTETIASILPPRQEEEISTGEQQESGMPDNLEGRETTETEGE